MNTAKSRTRWGLWVVGGCIAAGFGLLVWSNQKQATRPSPISTKVESFPIPPYSESRYENTNLDVRFVGSETCAECHRSNHQSYCLTAHSRALSDLDPAAEPPDGSFFHTPSGRSYRVYRQDGQFRHEEVLRDEHGKEMGKIDLPVKYLIGSGHFCRSYIVEVDGFLHESPITWYTSKKKWDMSPGYDFAQHWSFERPIKFGCLECHAGRVEETRGALNRLTLREKAIGCESCHGPGALHAEKHRLKKQPAGEDDWTIVNPGKLPRPRLEAICGVCHLSGAAPVLVRGREPGSYRPGMPLTDYRIDYRFDTGSEQMTVVGHMEQLRRSVCYQRSKDMSCLTCHDPHAKEKPKDPMAHHRQKCLDCHATQGCKLELSQRLKKDPADNCATCHMPRGDTDIPHIAFTHHRIGKHHQTVPPRQERVPELVPVEDCSHLSLLDQQRNLGLAYLEVARNPLYIQYRDNYTERARSLLDRVHAAGLRDGELASALAEVYWKKDSGRARLFAGEALGARDVSAFARTSALIILADCDLREDNPLSAAGSLEELVRLRRSSNDWRLLGVSFMLQRDPWRALRALEQAQTIRPYRHDIHLALAEVYQQLGGQQRAAEHRQKAEWLLSHRQE